VLHGVPYSILVFGIGNVDREVRARKGGPSRIVLIFREAKMFARDKK
jgi:hypothetical protein